MKIGDCVTLIEAEAISLDGKTIRAGTPGTVIEVYPFNSLLIGIRFDLHPEDQFTALVGIGGQTAVVTRFSWNIDPKKVEKVGCD